MAEARTESKLGGSSTLTSKTTTKRKPKTRPPKATRTGHPENQDHLKGAPPRRYCLVLLGLFLFFCCGGAAAKACSGSQNGFLIPAKINSGAGPSVNTAPPVVCPLSTMASPTCSRSEKTGPEMLSPVTGLPASNGHCPHWLVAFICAFCTAPNSEMQSDQPSASPIYDLSTTRVSLNGFRPSTRASVSQHAEPRQTLGVGVVVPVPYLIESLGQQPLSPLHPLRHGLFWQRSRHRLLLS